MHSLMLEVFTRIGFNIPNGAGKITMVLPLLIYFLCFKVSKNTTDCLKGVNIQFI